MTMIDRAPQREHEPAGHQGYRPQDIALSISSSPFDRVRTSSSESLPTLQEVTTWPAQMAYDAYHDADFTLAPTRGAFQPFSSGPHEELVTRSGRRDSSQGLLARPPATRRVIRGGVFPTPGGLDYQDFSPEVSGFDETGGLKCTETFADLVKRANDWLRQNPQLIVRSCETITWSTSCAVEVGDTESMVRESDVTQNGESSYSFSGLRLWVIPKDDSSNSSSLFSSPSSSSSASSSSMSCDSSASASSAPGGQRLGYRDYKPPMHRSSLSRLVYHVNQDLKERPLPGRISTCETVLVPGFLSLDTGCLLWTESHRHHHQQQQPRRCVVFLRLFYIIGSITQLQMIGVKNIVPQLVNGRYEPFSGLLQRATLWAKKEKFPIRITNFKSYNTPSNACSLEEEADRCSIIWPEPIPASTSHSASAFVPHQHHKQHYFQVLRVFYVRLHPVVHDCRSDDEANHVRPYVALHTSGCRTSDAVRADTERMSISCAVFSPAQVGVTNDLHEPAFERMRQTMLRIRLWMQTAGVNIHSIESYASPLLFNAPIHTLSELTCWAHTSVIFQRSKRKFLTHIRVYYEHSSSEPPRVPKIIAPNAIRPVSAAVDSVQTEEERLRRLKEVRWRKRKLHLVLSCIMTFAICIPAGGLFYLNALQTEWGKA